MHLLKPALISAEIVNLVDEAKDQLIIVSPYIDFDGWKPLETALERFCERSGNLIVVAREPERPNEHASLERLTSRGLVVEVVKRLHCKFYLNHKSGIVTSLNLLKSSHDKALEIGYITDTKEEYEELLSFYQTYIKSNFSSLAKRKRSHQECFDLQSFTDTVSGEVNYYLNIKRPVRSYCAEDYIRFNLYRIP